jgi:HEAT repeat protein
MRVPKLRRSLPVLLAILTVPCALAHDTVLASAPQKSRTVAKWSKKPAAAADESAAALDAAQTALKANHLDEAISRADQVLAKSPGNARAAEIKIEALVAGDKQQDALDAYDAFAKANTRGPVTLLAPIAKGELRAMSKVDLTSLDADALRVLATNGDAAAKRQLVQLSAAKTPSAASIAATTALARMGDAPAAQRLVAYATQAEASRRSTFLHEIANVPHAPALAVVRDSLKSSDPVVQATAAEAAAALGLKDLTPELKQVLATAHPFAQNAAAIALTMFGDADAKARVQTMMTSPAGSVRIQAAKALDAIGDKSWTEQIRPLLQDQDGLTRFQAAELLLPVDRAAALNVLQAGISDPNPVIRGESTRILTSDGKTEPGLLRILITDKTPQVRLLAANAVLTQARAATPARAADNAKVSH